MHTGIGRTKPGFTLVELLVVIAIVAILMTVAFVVGLKQVDKGKKVQALGQFRELAVGMESYISDNQKPPLKPADATSQMDTVYGDAGGENRNNIIVAALRGDMTMYSGFTANADTKTMNPTGQQYLDFPYSPDKKKGVAADGCLYDPWGKEIMIAVNTPPYNDDTGSPSGHADKQLWTFSKGEYTDTMPKQQQYVFWSFGKDGKKGNNAPQITAKVPYAGSDDVISW